MTAMMVKRSLALTIIVALFGSSDGQRMRKRVSPVLEIENPYANELPPQFDVKSNRERNLNREVGTSGALNNDEDYNGIKNRELGSKSEKSSGKQSGKRKRTIGSGSEVDLMDYFLAKNVRMNGYQMSMPSSPTKRPTSPGQVPTPKPTTNPAAPSPSQGCESLSREEALKQALDKVTDSSTLNDFSTPQGKAFVWIMDRDSAQIDPCNDDTLGQRFALATFYYSTNGGNWDNSARWMTDPNECSWIGIKCDGNGMVVELGANAALMANNLSGSLPEEIKALKGLEMIQLGENAIGGSIPNVLKEFPELRLFDIEINSFSGPAVVDLDGLNQLESYRVSANRFSGSIDADIGKVTSLRELWMADNQISGTIPESVGDLVNIETLYIYRNNLVGSLPETFGQLKRLRELQVFQNFLSGTVPESMYSNTELGLMRLDRNQFTGTISESIGNLRKLEDLRIDENMFTGKMPASFMNLSNLIVLRLNDNSFVGSIRDGFDMWTKLDFADFRNNGFDGTLPSTIFDLPSIRILYFANNDLDGTLPSNFGSSPVLRDLFLSGNQLTGSIPDIEVGQLTQLTELLLEDNRFTGTMAESICNLRTDGQGILEDLWVDCGNDADPRVECDFPSCCTACFPSAP